MPKIATLPDTASVQEIQRNYRALLNRVKASRNPLFILRNNLPEAVIVDVESWNLLAKKIMEAEENDALNAVREYEKEKKAGKLKVLRPGKLAKLLKA